MRREGLKMGQNIEWFLPAEVFAEASGRSRAVKETCLHLIKNSIP